MTRFDPIALRRLHISVDCGLVALAWLGAYWIRRGLNDVLGTPINSFDAYVEVLPIVVAPWITTCWLFGIYRASRMRTLVDELQTLMRGVALGLLVLASISFFVKELDIGRAVVLASAGLSLVFQGASRIFFYRVGEAMRRRGDHDVATLIVGTGVTAIRLLQKLQDHPEIGYRVVGLIDESGTAEEKDIAGHPVLGTLEDLRRIAREFSVQEIFIAAPGLGHTRMLSLVLECEDLGITFRVVTNLFEVLTAGSPLDLVDDLPVVRLGRQKAHALYEPLKRLMDIGGVVASLLLVGPLMLWCARRIRKESSGPALFVQDRVGRDGRIFKLYKFRTMFADADPYALAPQDKLDSRITPFGRWLRATSIDELPQILNVSRGEMSWVGPRPEMPFIVDTYDEWQRRRLTVKPGITGMWQILGRKDLPLHENLQYDFYYIRNRSLALDLSIIIRTIGAVFARRGAF